VAYNGTFAKLVWSATPDIATTLSWSESLCIQQLGRVEEMVLPYDAQA